MERDLGRINQACDFFLAQHDRKVDHLLRIGSLVGIPVPLESFDEEEPERGQSLIDRIGSQFSGPE